MSGHWEPYVHDGKTIVVWSEPNGQPPPSAWRGMAAAKELAANRRLTPHELAAAANRLTANEHRPPANERRLAANSDQDDDDVLSQPSMNFDQDAEPRRRRRHDEEEREAPRRRPAALPEREFVSNLERDEEPADLDDLLGPVVNLGEDGLDDLFGPVVNEDDGEGDLRFLDGDDLTLPAMNFDGSDGRRFGGPRHGVKAEEEEEEGDSLALPSMFGPRG